MGKNDNKKNRNNKNSKKTKKHKKKGKSKTIITIIAVIAIIAIFLVLLNINKIFPVAKSPVAIVNGKIITKQDIDATLKTMPAALRSRMTYESILNQTIMNKLLLEEAKKFDLIAKDSEVKKALDDSISLAKLTKQEFENYLTEQNLTMKDMEEFYKLHLSIENLIQKEIRPNVKISDEEVIEFYENNSEALENVSFKDAEEELRQFLENEALRKSLADYVTNLMSTSNIEILDNAGFDEPLFSEEIEKYSSCSLKNNVTKDTTLFIYLDSCPYCKKMKPIVNSLELDGYSFKWISADNNEGKKLLRDCFSDVLTGAVPQFICAKNGETIVGEMPLEKLQEFSVACSKL